MPDARIIIEGRAAGDVRYGTTQSGIAVANLRILAGRSKKDDAGNWQNLSTTAYNVSFWREHHDLVTALGPMKGDTVIVSGTVTEVESYDGPNGQSLSIKVNGDGLRVFAKQQPQGRAPQQGQQGGYGQPQGYGQQAPQNDPWGGGSGYGDPAPF